MSAWTPASRRLGVWSALTVVVLSVLYVITGGAWFVSHAGSAPRAALHPGDPYRAVLEFLLVLSAPAMVIAMAAVHAFAAPRAKTYGVVALTFMVLCAGVTSCIHFVELTVVWRLDPASALRLSSLVSFDWPSAAFALDLFAWDVFLGLSLLFAALVFRGDGLRAAIRISMIVSGALCVTGVLGPLLGNLRLQVIAIAGYAFGFPIVCVLLAMLFRRSPPDPAPVPGSG